MYTTELASKQRKKFWTIFGQYMKPVPGAGGEAVNWLNYKTGVRSVFFRMDADKQNAHVGIEIQHALEADSDRELACPCLGLLSEDRSNQ